MLSVLIPTYNHDPTRLIYSLKEQLEKFSSTYEILVYDDGSNSNWSDSSEKNIFKNIKLLKGDQNRGRTFSRQKLAEASHYNWLLFLDADVLPERDNFIKTYLNAIREHPGKTAFFGGYSYNNIAPKNKKLRWRFGKKREELSAVKRNRFPYKVILSGNMLIDKKVFIDCNSDTENKYGSDPHFSAQLKQMNIPIHHLDNTVIHYGIEDNHQFLSKIREAIHTLHKSNQNGSIKDHQISLLIWVDKIKKWKGRSLVSWVFKYCRIPLEKNLLSGNPSLRILDFYKLGYFLSLDKNESHA